MNKKLRVLLSILALSSAIGMVAACGVIDPADSSTASSVTGSVGGSETTSEATSEETSEVTTSEATSEETSEVTTSEATSEETSEEEAESSAPEVATYTVKFVDDNGDTISETTYEEGAAIVAPEDPTKEDSEGYSYTFAGWDSTVAETATADVTYTATYTKTAIEYVLSFNHHMTGMPLMESITYTVETMDEIEFPAVPADFEREGYTVAWDKTEADLAIGGLVVVPVWTAIEYKLTFMNDTTPVAEVPFTVESTEIEVPAIPEKTGYTGVWSDYDLTKLENQTVTLSYTANTYTVTYDVNGGSGDASVEVTYDDSYVLSKATAPKAYQEFLGWQDADGKTVAMEGTWTIAGDVTLKAIYSDGVVFDSLESVPSYMAAADSTDALSIVELNGNKVLEMKVNDNGTTAADRAPALKVTLEFLKSFFDDENVDYVAFDAKTRTTNINNFRRVTLRANGSFAADCYEPDLTYDSDGDKVNDTAITGIRSDAFKTFYFSRADYEAWVAQGVTSEKIIATGQFNQGDNIYVDNIRPVTAAEREAGMYGFESGGLRVNDGGQTLLLYTLSSGDWKYNIQVESGKVFTNPGFTNENVTEGIRALQFTKAAGSFSISLTSSKLAYTEIATKTNYWAVDIYVPEDSDAAISYHITTWAGVTLKKGGWTTVYVTGNNTLKVVDTTGGTYMIDNMRAITEEEYQLAALGFEANVSGLRTKELGDDTAHSGTCYYYGGADHKANTFSFALVEGNGEGDVGALKNVSYSSEVAHSGAYSLAIEKGTGYMYLTMRDDSTAYSLLKDGFTFWVYSTVAIDGVNTINFINGDNGKFNGGEGVMIPANTWTQITVTASDINSGGRFLIIQGGGATAGTIYLDDFSPLSAE